jgi:hypothetical protein
MRVFANNCTIKKKKVNPNPIVCPWWLYEGYKSEFLPNNQLTFSSHFDCGYE